MGLRPGHCYTKVKRAYTRKSKYKKKSFIKAVPPVRIAKFDLGNLKKDYNCEVNLVSKQKLQVRENALESARQMVIRHLEKGSRPFPYHFKLRVYPHHALRENKMLTGAGADRMQTGMQKAFGKVIGSAVRVKKGQALFTVYVDKDFVDPAVNAFKKAIPRLPCKCDIVLNEKS